MKERGHMDLTTIELAELQKQVDKLNEQLRELTETEKDVIDNAREKLTRAVDTLKDRGAKAGKEVRRMAKQADEYAHENPWQIAAAAAVVALAAGWVIGRARR